MTYAGPVLVAFLTLVAAGAAALDGPADPDAAVAAVFPPWWDRARVASAVAGADGLILREGPLATILLVRPASPGLAGRLHGNGAVMVLDPGAARGCLGPA